MKNRVWLYIFLLALAARIAAVTMIAPQVCEPETIATNVLQGRGYVFAHFGGALYRSYIEPLYPFVCVITYFFTRHSLLAMELVQVFFSGLTAVVIYFIARRIYAERVACLAALLVALHPGLIVYTTKLHPLTFDALLISLVAQAVIRLFKKISWQNTIIAGLISGLCILSRPTVLVFLPLALVYIFKLKKVKLGESLRYAGLFFVVAGCVFLPWTVRNYVVHREFMLTRSNAPFVFWLGNNPQFSGSAMQQDGRTVFESAPQDFQQQILKLDEIAQNKAFFKAALSYIKAYPLGFAIRTMKKFYYFWWFNPQAGIFYPPGWLLGYKLFYALLLIFGLIGIIFTYLSSVYRHKAEAGILMIILFTVSFVQSLFYIETRHRWAIEPIFLVFAAFGLNTLFLKLNQRGQRWR